MKRWLLKSRCFLISCSVFPILSLICFLTCCWDLHLFGRFCSSQWTHWIYIAFPSWGSPSVPRRNLLFACHPHNGKDQDNSHKEEMVHSHLDGGFHTCTQCAEAFAVPQAALIGCGVWQAWHHLVVVPYPKDGQLHHCHLRLLRPASGCARGHCHWPSTAQMD